jgi:hypothetical protein
MLSPASPADHCVMGVMRMSALTKLALRATRLSQASDIVGPDDLQRARLRAFEQCFC